MILSPKSKASKSKSTKEQGALKEETKEKQVKNEPKDSNNETKPEVKKKKSKTLSALDLLDDVRVEGHRKTSEKLKGLIKEKEKEEKEKKKPKDEDIREEKELSVVEIKNMMTLLKARKEECFNTGMYEEAIAIANDIIDLAKKAKMNIRIEQEKTSISKMRDLIENRASEKMLLEKIEGLKAIKHNFYVKEDYQEAINTSYKIINYAKKLDMKSLVKKEGKSIEAMNKKLAKAPLKTDPKKQIEGLKAVKQDHLVKFNFTQAIKVTEKIIQLATRGGLKSIVKEEKKALEEIKKKIKQEPSKMELIEQIEGLKGVKQGHAVKGDYKSAIKVSQKIIEFAKIANLESIIQEEENAIEEMQEKLERESYITTIKKECRENDDAYDKYIDDEEIVKAHELIEDFKNKYIELSFFNSIPGVKDLFEKDKKVWLRYKVKQDYIKAGKEKEKPKEKIEKSIPKVEKPKPKVDKAKVDKGKPEQKKKEELKEEKVKFVQQEVPVIPERELKRFELENAKLEEEKARLRLERLRFEKQKEKFEIENKKVELDKVELEENISRLKLGKVRLKKDKERFELEKEELELAKKLLEEENIKLEESQSDFEKDDKALEREITEFHKEKEKFEKTKVKLEEKGVFIPDIDETELELEKAAIEEEKAEIKLERAKLKKEIVAIKEEKAILQDERKKLEKEKLLLEEKGVVMPKAEDTDLELEKAAIEEEKAELEHEKAKLKKEKASLSEEKKAIKEERKKFEEMKVENNDMKKQLKKLKTQLKDKEAKEKFVSEADLSEEIELELAALDEEKANLKLEYAKIKKEKLQLKLDKKNFLKEKVKFEEEKTKFMANKVDLEAKEEAEL